MKTLTWKVTKRISAPCPDYQPNPYTGEYPSTHCLVYHFQDIIEERTATFETEKEALDFAEKAPSECTEFRLNGELIKDKRKMSSTTVISQPTDTSLTMGNGTTTQGNINL